jgi:hypothetical protein
MIRRITIASAVLACCASLPARAVDGLSNSYLDVRYLNSVVEYDVGLPNPVDDEVEGFDAAVSIGLMPYLNFIGTYVSHRYGTGRRTGYTTDPKGLPAGRDGFASAGLAGHTMGRTWQVFGAATYEQLEVDRTAGPGGFSEPNPNGREDGWGVTLGARYVLPNLEVQTSAKYAAYTDFKTLEMTGLTYEVGAGLQLTPYWTQTFGGRYRTLELEPETGTSLTVNQMEWTVGFRRYFVTSGDKWKRKGGILWWGD